MWDKSGVLQFVSIKTLGFYSQEKQTEILQYQRVRVVLHLLWSDAIKWSYDFYCNV